MNWLDILVLASVAVAALIGWWIGLIRVVVGLVGTAVGIALASRYHAALADAFTSKFIDSPGGAKVAAFLIILVAVMLAAILLTAIVKKILSLLLLGWLDKLLGVALAVLVVLSIYSAVLSAAYSTTWKGAHTAIDGSFMGKFLVDEYAGFLKGVKVLPERFK